MGKITKYGKKMYGRTMEEIRANSIANDIFDALARFEMSDVNPNLILDQLKQVASSTPQKGIREAIEVLRKHYCGDEDV